jgi:protein TonB
MRIPHRPRIAALILVASCLAACDRAAPTTASPAVPAPSPGPLAISPQPATAPADTDLGELIAAANAEFRRGRYAAPAGANALEGFLAVRERDPGNPGALEALVDLYPFALATAGTALAAGDREETRRILALLDRAAPESLGVRELRARLDAAALPANAASSASSEPSATPAAAPIGAPEPTSASGARALPAGAPAPMPETPKADPADPAQSAEPPAAAAAPAAAQRPDIAPAPPAPRGQAPGSAAVSPPVLTERVEPAYPDLARRRRIEGWVDLEFDIDRSGRPSGIRVVESSPSAIFDAAAQRALQRWRFQPAQRDGVPEAARSRTRIVFRLG